MRHITGWRAAILEFVLCVLVFIALLTAGLTALKVAAHLF